MSIFSSWYIQWEFCFVIISFSKKNGDKPQTS